VPVGSIGNRRQASSRHRLWFRPTRYASANAGLVRRTTTESSATPSMPGSNAVTDAKGRFKLTGFADGQYDLDVSATGYLGLAKPVVIAGAKSHGPIVVGLTPLIASDGCN